jgi:hypothetical protein
MCGVDLDLFIAVPADPEILTDAASCGRFPYCANPKLFETQELLRISQAPGKGYLTLLVQRWPDSEQPKYRTIADGAGVSIQSKGREDRLFISPVKASYKDEIVTFAGRTGFARIGGSVPLRLMFAGGQISSKGITLKSERPASMI